MDFTCCSGRKSIFNYIQGQTKYQPNVTLGCETKGPAQTYAQSNLCIFDNWNCLEDT